jgi:hypothetical protein
VTDSNKTDSAPTPAPEGEAPGDERTAKPSSGSGPTFNESPDPLSGVSKWASDTWRSTEGRTVSLRVYIGTIVGVVLLMMLARCGG